MHARYLLGIDAGATKTHYLLYDRKLGCMDMHTGGTANHESLEGGFAELEVLLAKETSTLLSRNGITPADIAGAGFGIAGVDTKKQHGIISAIFTGLGFQHFGLANDAALGIKAECLSGSGVCAINGSGFSVYAMDGEGNAAQRGGLGDLTGDKGGGGYLVGRAMAAVYAHTHMQGKATAMTAATFALLGITNPDDFLETLTDKLYGTDSKVVRMQLSQMLHKSAAAGDAVAHAILVESGQAYAAAILGAVKALPALAQAESIPVVLAGSGFTRCECPLAQETIACALDLTLGKGRCSISRISSDPVLGAILWAHTVAGLCVDVATADNCRSLLAGIQ